MERNELIMRVYTTRNYLTKVFKGRARILRGQARIIKISMVDGCYEKSWLGI
ncbi:MAG: hypothetical protein OD815_001036 [Candidatus Alkanophagales archaeon MCA70_species_2]|nr:hypothetical protein [Candidatus Alkanophaga liquidiphilum]